jgi:Integrase zinc binding domain
LSRDTFLTRRVTLCNRCLNGVEEVEDIVELEARGNEGDAITWDGVARTLITVEEMRTEQRKEYGVDSVAGTVLEEDYVQDEDSIWCKVGNIVRVLVPPSLRARVLQQAHGERTGHWGVPRTAAKVRSQYYWPGWLCDVKKCVQQCLGAPWTS